MPSQSRISLRALVELQVAFRNTLVGLSWLKEELSPTRGLRVVWKRFEGPEGSQVSQPKVPKAQGKPETYPSDTY
jgi:hypothetical protein